MPEQEKTEEERIQEAADRGFKHGREVPKGATAEEEAIKRLIRSQSFSSQNLIASALRGEYQGDGSKP